MSGGFEGFKIWDNIRLGGRDGSKIIHFPWTYFMYGPVFGVISILSLVLYSYIIMTA